MTDKEIYEFLVNEEQMDHLIIKDEEEVIYELEQLGILPLHGVIYAVTDLLKINNVEVTEEEAGLVLFELDYDEETDEYFVLTVEDDELFDEVIKVFEEMPIG